MITITAFGSTSTVDARWTASDVRHAVRREHGLTGAITVTLGDRRGVAAHVDEHGDLLVVHVGRVA